MRPSALLTTIVCATFVVASVGVPAATARPTARASEPAPPTGASPAAGTRLRLVTGDDVDVRPGAHGPQVTVLPRTSSGLAGQMTRLTLSGHSYVIPGEARRYLDRVLDRSLFDVTALAAHAGAAPQRIVVTVAPGATPAVPGMTVTSHSSSSAQGYFTAAGAVAFGTALTVRARADGLAHRTPTSLFGITRMAVAGAVVAAPAFQQYTLTIKGIDPSGGAADDMFVVLANVDDGRKFSNAIEVVDGVAKVSVPAGTYAAIGEYDTFTRTSYTSYLVPVENIHVTGSTTTVLDARTATVVPSVHTPRPAALVQESLEWDRSTAHSSTGYSESFGPGGSVRVASTGPATSGRLDWVTGWTLTGTPATGEPYTYDLSYDDSGRVPADQSRTVTTGALAALHTRYYTDQQARLAAFGRAAFYPFQFGIFTALPPLPTPLARTEYVYAPASARWSATLIAAPNDDDPFQGIVSDGDRAYAAGSTQDVDWLRGPLAPGIASATPGTQSFVCSACRDAKTLDLFFDPYDDTTPGHSGTFDLPDDTTVAARFRLYRNGSLIDDKKNTTGDVVGVKAASATYRAVVSTERGLVGFATSTHAVEDVTVVSAAGSGPHPPSAWQCPNDPPCSVLPVLTATVPLPTDLTGTMPLGANTMTFTVGHVQAAARPAISAVTFATSTDGGASYHSTPVTALGSGRYRVTLTNAAASAGHGIGIRISAVDAAGGRLTETVDNAYYVAQS